MEDWYFVTGEDIKKYGGGGLLHKYNNSLSGLLVSNFPSYPWRMWKFVHSPIHYWNQIQNQVSNLTCIFIYPFVYLE